MLPLEERNTRLAESQQYHHISGDLLAMVPLDDTTVYAIGTTDERIIFLYLTTPYEADAPKIVVVPSIPVDYDANLAPWEVVPLRTERVRLRQHRFRVGNYLVEFDVGFSKSLERWFKRIP